MALDFLNYKKIREGNKEFTRTDLWEINFITVPQCYFPGEDFINQRCTSVSPALPSGVQIIGHTIRGFQVNQASLQEVSAGTASLTFVDREDLAIRTWVEEWKELMSKRENLKGSRKEAYTCDLEIIYYNTSRVPIEKITLYNCILSQGAPMEDGSNESSSSSDITMSLNYEYFERKYLNGIK